MSEHVFEVTRILDAPRELVFKVWTESTHLTHWWGPVGMQLEVHQLDLHPDGIFHYSMTAPNGNKMWGKFVYQEITAPEKLVYVSSFADEAGNTARAPFSPIFPLEVLNTMTFEEHEGQTKLILRGGPINATEEEREFYAAMADNMQQGFAGTFAQLEAYLAKA